jgi:arsenite methyltransferase
MYPSEGFTKCSSKVKSNITSMALPDGIADIVCSNCVINLVPETEKPAVFHEIFRILKPGGRIAISDILTKQRLPEIIKKNAAMLTGCISGASMPAEYEKWMSSAGFKGHPGPVLIRATQDPNRSSSDIVIVDTKKDINVYLDPQFLGGSGCCTKAPAECLKETGELPDLNAFVGSFQIYAVKLVV